MEKILTISIAAYNVEKYIRKTLDSLIDDSIIDDLEIFVVDDGGTDRTLEIAQEYADRYPQSIFPIHKENGGYGSTINTSIELATGKFFKQLDGDDWYDTQGLIKFVNALRDISADCVLTYWYQYIEKTGEYVCKNDFSYIAEGEYEIESSSINERFSIKNVTYKTKLLRDMKERFTENCFYTDAEFATYPVSYVNTVYVCHFPVYVYRIGREEQSVSKNGIRKHYREQEIVFWHVEHFYVNKTVPDKPVQKRVILLTLKMLFYDWYRFRLYLPLARSRVKEMKRFENRVNKTCPEVIELTKKDSRIIRFLIDYKDIVYPAVFLYYRIRSSFSGSN